MCRILRLFLSGPGLIDNITYGPYDFKDDDNDLTTEALNPQAVFFIQVDNNIIKLSDNFYSWRQSVVINIDAVDGPNEKNMY